MMKRLLLIIGLFLIVYSGLFAQSSRITGRVVDADNNPVVGASVTVSGTSQGTVTDANGNFAISAPQNGSLLINSIGFRDEVVEVGNRGVINVSLSPGQSAGLEEVVVTGYTSQRKKDIIGSVSVVDVKALKAVPAPSAMQALQGQASGVDIINTGSPGSQSNIFIRGITGFSTAPLVLIDGVQGQINDVPANDVESIQVLKDAGAASIYGARGSNGVIIITTRKGKSGAPLVSYDSYYNLQIPRSEDNLDLLTTEEYARIWSEISPATALFPGGAIPDYIYRSGLAGPRGIGNEGDMQVNPSLYNFDPLDVNNNYIIARLNKTGRTKMYDEIMDPALMMNHTISASGGSERANYLLSFGYLDHQGTMENTFLKRYNMRVNTTFKIRNNVRVGQNLNIYYKNNPTKSVNGGFGPINSALNHLPFLPVYDIAGNFAGPFAGPGIADMGDWGNPKAEVSLVNNNRFREYGMVGNAFLEIDFLKNFTARTSFGGSIMNFYDQFFEYSPYWKASGGNNTHRLTENSGFFTLAQWTNTLSYKNQFGKHNVSVIAGSESVENKFRRQGGTGEKYFSTEYEYLVLGNATTRQLPVSSASEDALFSLFGRLDYGFDDRYLVGITVRRDGFSAFGPDSKYGVFPAVALGWRLSQEKFMQGVSWVNDLKIRSSYGVMGNKEGINPANAYTTFGQDPQRSYYDVGGLGNAIVQGFYPLQNGNTFTSWEKNKLFNIGFDGTFFNNKFDLSIEYYKKSTEGLLRVRQAPATAGEANSPFVNIGNIENKGIDINTTYRARVNKDFNFYIGANFTTYKNEIVSIPEPGFVDEGLIRYEEGHPMSSFFGYQVVGVFRDQKEVDDHAIQQDAQPGRYKYFDADGNDTINALDRVHYGHPNPDFTLGLNLGANFRNFDFSAQLYTVQGIDILNTMYQTLGAWEVAPSNKHRRVLDAWTESNTNTNVKKNETGRNFSNTGVNNSAIMEDGSFVRLRSVLLGYTFRNTSLTKVGLSSLRLYLQGTNLVTFTSYSGIDPEVSLNAGNSRGAQPSSGQRGIDNGAYVPEAGIVFGLNLTF